MTKVIMHGCNGKMGRFITDLISQEEDMELVAGVDTYDGVPNTYPVYASINEVKEDADVVIDFSNASAVDGVQERILPVCFVLQDFPRNSWKMCRRHPSRWQS